MWKKGWRDEIWSKLDQEWDIVIIGGGITGAGILREAVDAGYKALLVEANDFSFGTSSRSSKLVHGGFRYLRNKQFDVTHESVKEREWLLKEAKHLVTPLSFLMPTRKDNKTPGWQMQMGVIIYDLMAPKWQHKTYSKEKMLKEFPQMDKQNLVRGHIYYDAQMDDSMMVVRLIREAVDAGGTAINYAKAISLIKDSTGQVAGIQVEDKAGLQSRKLKIKAKVVINATGPWSDFLREQVGKSPRIRKLRGSHLIFSRDKFPLERAVTLLHPKDNRAMFALPWEGTSMIGTTDLDHDPAYENGEPFTTQGEIDYIMEALHFTFPDLDISKEDIISSFAGLRPIISTGKAKPSDESRAHQVWNENGLITITGGKITIFRIMAEDVLKVAMPYLSSRKNRHNNGRMFNALPVLKDSRFSTDEINYLSGRYGMLTQDLLDTLQLEDTEHIDNLPNIWGELRWAARNDAVVHLDDLLLRRIRIGMLLPKGAIDHMDRIKSIVQPELGWSNEHWEQEVERYKSIWQNAYSPSPKGYQA
jgi:glycerol-3-phosphate dehydrogenase